MTEPYSPSAVKRLLVAILATGSLRFSRHAYDEMAKDGLRETDVVNTLRAGVPQPGEFEDGTYRYRVLTSRLGAVVAFRSETQAVVVTAWRIKK